MKQDKFKLQVNPGDYFNESKNDSLIKESREIRIDKYGLNKQEDSKFNYVKVFFMTFLEPFNILLLCISLLQLLLYLFVKKEAADLVSSIFVFLMVILAVVVDFIQTIKIQKINNSLVEKVENKYYITNDNYDIFNPDFKELKSNVICINEFDLTVGDILYLSQGDIIPADAKIIWANNLLVDQSTFTGESELKVKTNNQNETDNLFELENILLCQSTIESGVCFAQVFKIGNQTYSNHIVNNEESSKSSYEIGLAKVVKRILLMILVCAPIIMLIFGLKTGEWVDAVIFAIVTVVSLTPEALPAIIAANLQYGAKKMAEQNILIKDFKTVQIMGSVDLLITDKTGTLTTDDFEIIDFEPYQFDKQKLKELFYLNSSLQTSFNNLIDKKIVNALGGEFKSTTARLLEESSFNHIDRTLTTVVDMNGKIVQITKGAIEEILNLLELDKQIKDKLLQEIKILNERGILTIGLLSGEKDKLTFKGYIKYKSELKESAVEAINLFYKNNIDLKIATGDNLNTTLSIAKELKMNNLNYIEGTKDLINHADSIGDYAIYSKLTPDQKRDVIDFHKSKGYTVAYICDGVNDIPALKGSDVGISVNNAKSITKKYSDIIMLEKDLSCLEQGFIQGRSIFTNAIKFIKITIAVNFGLMCSIILSTALFDFHAMSPIQLLLQNLIYDFSNLSFIFDKVDDKSIKKPSKWKTNTFVYFAIINGLVSFAISTMNFMIIGYGFGLVEDISNQSNLDLRDNLISQFQTYFFLESFITHMMLIVVLRTEFVSVIKSNPSIGVSISLVCYIILAFLVSMTPVLNDLFGFTNNINLWWLAIMFGLILATWMLGETVKIIYKKIFKSWF